MKQPRGDKSHITPDYKDMSAGCFVFPTSSKQPKQHRIVRTPNTERFSIYSRHYVWRVQSWFRPESEPVIGRPPSDSSHGNHGYRHCDRRQKTKLQLTVGNINSALLVLFHTRFYIYVPATRT